MMDAMIMWGSWHTMKKLCETANYVDFKLRDLSPSAMIIATATITYVAITALEHLNRQEH